MTLRRTLQILLGTLLLSSVQAQGTTAEAQSEALATAYGVVLGAQAVRDYCVQNAPASAAVSRQTYAAWEQAQGLSGFEARLDARIGADLRARLKTALKGSLGNLNAALAKLGPASTVCAAYPAQLKSSAFNVRAKVPTLPSILAAQPSGTQSGSSQGGTAAPAGLSTVYTVAQLSTLAGQTLAAQPKGASGSDSEDAVFRKLQSLGRVVAVTGQIREKGGTLTQTDERREVKWNIYCYNRSDIDLPPAGQTVTLVGSIREFDRSTFITLDDCQVLGSAQAAALKKSTLPTADVGWRFLNQPAEKFLVAAGQGLKDSELLGVFTQQSYTTGVGGMVVLTYEPYLFLKDGTVYNDPYWAPSSFNAKLSRDLEPQKWGKWTRQGQTFQITWGDGQKETFKVVSTLKPSSAGLKLSGTYSTLSGGGNTALGGDVVVAAGGDYTFTPGGSFSGARFGSGSTSTVTTTSKSSSTGSYKVSGYGITLRDAGGQERRLLFYVVDDKMLHIGSSDYLK